ncbi:MAG: hypothetical protein KGL39_36715 [Patescibacteria group bacterium]|nr:hypothetical protein [Patescibacteria group bacterium]
MKPAVPQKRHGFEAELGSVKIELASVKTSIGSLQDSMKSLSDHMDGLFRRFDQMNRPNFGLWISVLSFAATAFVGFWVVLDLKVRDAVTPVQMGMVEVETQFNADAQLRNVQWSEQQRLNAMLWNASALGKLTPYPEASPYYQPNISKEAR